jgi:uncharacterized membrane protein YeiH
MLSLLFLIGICVEGISGAMAAGRKSMDLFGVITIACIAAFGGGTVRDILFNTYPLTWVETPSYLIYVAIAALLTPLISKLVTKVYKLFLVFDALGLATFVILGTQRMLDHHMSPSIAILGGLITGIFGGILRDILCNEVPLVLRSELYAMVALLGSMLMVILDQHQVSSNLSIVGTWTCMASLRLVAIRYKWRMPIFDLSSKKER